MKHYCVIGFPISHSLSPQLHNSWFKKFKLRADYVAKEVKPGELSFFMKNFVKNFDGANVTIPHKENIIAHLDSISEEARKIGAVNTIAKKGSKLIGYNTDVLGALQAIKVAQVRLKGKKALVLGAGGAARAVIYGLSSKGARVFILNRTVSKAKKLAREFKCEVAENDVDLKSFQLIINTTSVGMKSRETPLPNLKNRLGSGAVKRPVVMDIIYTPLMTKFLKEAKACGCKIITGDKMFRAQAAASFKIWTGQTKPL